MEAVLSRESEAPELLLGFDIGGTKTAYVLSDTEGLILSRHRAPTALSGDPRSDVRHMAEEALGLLGRTRAEVGANASGPLVAAGASVPGPFDPERGVLLHPPNMPGWEEVPVRDWLAEALGCPVGLENDANAAALAEWRFGAGQGHSNVVYLTMSTGVGGGLILDGRVHRGAGCGAGEVGHVAVEWPGDLCGCGMRGCLEAYVGGLNWMKRLQSVTPEGSEVAKLAGGAQNARPEHVVEAARAGCAFALAEFERFNGYLARGIAQLTFTLDPSVIVLGTICVAAGEELCFAPLRDAVRKRLWPNYAETLNIVPAALGEDLPYRTGVCVALQAFEALKLTRSAQPRTKC
jgi:glucokinase